MGVKGTRWIWGEWVNLRRDCGGTERRGQGILWVDMGMGGNGDRRSHGQ